MGVGVGIDSLLAIPKSHSIWQEHAGVQTQLPLEVAPVQIHKWSVHNIRIRLLPDGGVQEQTLEPNSPSVSQKGTFHCRSQRLGRHHITVLCRLNPLCSVFFFGFLNVPCGRRQDNMWKFIGMGHMRIVNHSSEGFPDFILYQKKNQFMPLAWERKTPSLRRLIFMSFK